MRKVLINLGRMKNSKILKKNYEFRLVLRKGKYHSGRYIESFILKNNLLFNKIRNCC